MRNDVSSRAHQTQTGPPDALRVIRGGRAGDRFDGMGQRTASETTSAEFRPALTEEELRERLVYWVKRRMAQVGVDSVRELSRQMERPHSTVAKWFGGKETGSIPLIWLADLSRHRTPSLLLGRTGTIGPWLPRPRAESVTGVRVRGCNTGGGNRMRALVMVLGVAFVAAACGGGEPESTKYVQTWDKDYGDTSCDDFTQRMTERQAFVLAGDMLLRAQRVETPDAPVESDERIEAFATALTVACAQWPIASEITMPEVAATRYILGDFTP